MPAIEFPLSTSPSINITENGGRLINAIVERAPAGSRGDWLWRSAPGLARLVGVGAAAIRGAIPVANALIVIAGDTAYEVIQTGPAAYSVTALTGTVSGTGPVIMARNMRSTPQTLIVHNAGMSKIEGGAVADFTDPDLPQPNSITYQDGYFFATIGDGRVFASGIDDVTFSALDFATARAAADPLIRGVAFSSDLLIMNGTTIEFWNNTANPEGFPYSRGPVITLGLFGALAVTGFEYGFPSPIAWVASDKRIYRLVGYTPEPISTPHIDRLIAAVSDPAAIEASCFVAAGHPYYVFTGPDWTLVYDPSVPSWHERRSYGQDRWKARFSALAFGKWVTFDRASQDMFAFVDRHRWDGADPLVWELWSSQSHRFPGRTVIRRATFDMVTGVGSDVGVAPIETNPSVAIAWSVDGGRTFGNDDVHDLGTQGELKTIDVRRLGMTDSLGIQYRLKVSDPVEVSLMGGAHDAAARS